MPNPFFPPFEINYVEPFPAGIQKLLLPLLCCNIFFQTYCLGVFLCFFVLEENEDTSLIDLIARMNIMDVIKMSAKSWSEVKVEAIKKILEEDRCLEQA